jgi:hypothetical protein
MRRLFKIIFIFIFIWSLTNTLLLSQPKLFIVGGTQIDFGDVPNFTPTKRTLVIKNIGTETLILSEVGATCGCTATLLSNDHLAPKDSALLYITFDAKRFIGQVEKMVSMVTNDDAQRSVEIKFTANVIKMLDINPEYFYVRAAKNSPVSQSIKIKNLGTENIKILSVLSSLDILKPHLSKDIIKPNEEVTLTVTFLSKSMGTTNGNINIKTDNPKASLLSIRFFGITIEE